MNRDTVIGIVGAVVLVVAMVGVFQYERVQASQALGNTPGAGDLVTTAGPSLTGTVAYQGKSEETVSLDTADLTKVEYTLTWTAQNGEDTLKLHVVPPEGTNLEATGQNPAEGASGSLTVAFDVPEGTDATGDWTVHVEFVGATGVQEIPGVGPVQPDEQVDWKLETKLTHPGTV